MNFKNKKCLSKISVIKENSSKHRILMKKKEPRKVEKYFATALTIQNFFKIRSLSDQVEDIDSEHDFNRQEIKME